MKNKVLILINSSSGLYSFRKELIEALKKDAEVFASTPDSGKVDLINDMGCQLIDTEIDRRGSNPLRDLKLLPELIPIFPEGSLGTMCVLNR